MAELLLDSDIRIWVFLPIVVITFLVGIIRHYVTILLSTEKKVELQQISDRYIAAYLIATSTVALHPLRSLVTSVLSHFGPRSEVHIHFGPQSFRS